MHRHNNTIIINGKIGHEFKRVKERVYRNVCKKRKEREKL